MIEAVGTTRRAPEGDMLPSIEEQRDALRRARFESPSKHRIVFVGRFFQGATGIVASLHRALESLGHTVFELEYARHKDAFDRSSGATGGYGPVFFRPEVVEAIFRSFDPELVVFCAGGVVLDSEAARWFRDRDIMTIGLTLSDPDVQDSVINHVGNFDYHTTNAELALDRYHAEGHSNTFLMPFGIDRDYILRDVPPAPELAADAICIGHAAGRPERHEVMGRLAELVNVRVYGNGWPLPGAEPVSGDRLLQAAHEGLIHVNFPATRAGFTNVKCGVFETIGAGSILATARFDEMARLFDYGEEILGYDSAEDLAQQIAELKAAPEDLERLRRRGFARLLSEHLYEHRWLRLLADIEQDLEAGASGKSADERARLSRIMARTHGRPRHVIISGFYGAQNRGDDLLLDAIASSLRAADEDVNVIVAGVQATEVERTAGYQAFRRSDAHVAERYASMASSVILGAGGLWHDYTIAKAGGVAGIVTGAVVSPSHLVQLPLMARAYGGSLHVYGMGVGPLRDEAAKAAVRLTGSLASSVTVRDEESLAQLTGVADAWAAQPVVAPDAVYSLPLQPSSPSIALPERFIALNVRPWGDGGETPTRLRDMVLRISERIGLPVVALPMQTIDERALAPSGSSTDDFAASVPSAMAGAEFLGVIQRAAVVVSMRLHANLLAHRLARPAVGFSYDPKVRSHFNQLGREDFVVDLDVAEHELEAVIRSAIDEGSLPTPVVERVRELEDQSAAAIGRVAQAIATGPLQVSPTGGMVHDLPTQPKAARGIPDATIWPESQSIDVHRAIVSSGNEEDAAREVGYTRKRSRAGDTFALDVRAPRAGDFVEWSFPVPARDSGTRLELWVKQRYAEQPKMRGYLAYSVHVGDQELFEQDITEWQPRNTVWVALGPSSQARDVRVRLRALRNCPDWNWGPASAMTIERGRQEDWAGTAPIVWGASSPFARSGVEPALEALRGLAGSVSGTLERAAAQLPEPGPRGTVVSEPGTLLKLESARVTSGNLADADADVAHTRNTSDAGDVFGLVDGAPHRGDFVEWAWEPRGEGGVRVELWIQQKYGEKSSVRNHLAYSVLVGDRVLFTQDVAEWQPRNTVWVALGRQVPDRTIRVRLHALKDCPDWKWGASTPIIIERVRTLEWSGSDDLLWGASSPLARPAPSAREAILPASSPTALSRVMRAARRMGR